MSAKLEEFAHVADMLRKFNEFNKLSDESFRVIKRRRMEMNRIGNFNNPGFQETVIPDMKILIVDGKPKIYSRYPN